MCIFFCVQFLMSLLKIHMFLLLLLNQFQVIQTLIAGYYDKLLINHFNLFFFDNSCDHWSFWEKQVSRPVKYESKFIFSVMGLIRCLAICITVQFIVFLFFCGVVFASFFVFLFWLISLCCFLAEMQLSHLQHQLSTILQWTVKSSRMSTEIACSLLKLKHAKIIELLNEPYRNYSINELCYCNFIKDGIFSIQLEDEDELQPILEHPHSKRLF